MLNKNQRLGKIGETAAYEYLQKENYIILEVNYRCKQGEIDIIAEDGEYLVFVEVKTRSSNFLDLPQRPLISKNSSRSARQRTPTSPSIISMTATSGLMSSPSSVQAVLKQISHL